MFLKRFGRSRGNSQSYVDDDFERDNGQQYHQAISNPLQTSSSPQQQQPQKAPSVSQQATHPADLQQQQQTATSTSLPVGSGRPPSSYRNPPAEPHPSELGSGGGSGKMFNSGSARTSTDYGNRNTGSIPRGSSGLTRDSGYADDTTPNPLKTDSFHSAPDPLTRAFNEAIRPFHEKIESLEAQMQDMQSYIETLEHGRNEIFAWIDKRGLRPDVPVQIAKQMDATSDAASSLNAQLDRKITIVNFDLHRLQDDLNDSISSAHFASAMAKFLPDVDRLAELRGGPRYAYELVIKLVGNLNSHGGLEAGAGNSTDAEIQEDYRARNAFYARMDDELLKIIDRRNSEGEDWAISREVKRLEKNGAYLKNLGIDSYFPKSLEAMRHDAQFAGDSATPPRYQ